MPGDPPAGWLRSVLAESTGFYHVQTESRGEPRQEIDHCAQVRDYRHAITFACTLQEVDRSRIGIWGSSSSGGHVLVLGAIDRRVKCVASQVPLASGYRNILRLVRADHLAGLRANLDADREARFAGSPPAVLPVVAEDPMAPCALPTPDSWEWFSETGKTRAPAWRNEVTLRSVEMLMEYEPASYIARINVLASCSPNLSRFFVALSLINRITSSTLISPPSFPSLPSVQNSPLSSSLFLCAAVPCSVVSLPLIDSVGEMFYI